MTDISPQRNLPNTEAGSPLVSSVTPNDTTDTGKSFVTREQIGNPDLAPEEDPLVVGRFAAATEDDNSVAVGNEGYIGTSDEYQNSAHVNNEAFLSEDSDIKEREQAAAEHQESLKREVLATNPALTFEPDTTHPSERRKPQDTFIEQNREILRRAASGE